MKLALIALAAQVAVAQEPAVVTEAVPAPTSLELNLVCRGTATRVETASTNIFLSGSGESANGFGQTSRRVTSNETMRLQFSSGGGRVFVPQAMRPGLRAGGDPGMVDVFGT